MKLYARAQGTGPDLISLHGLFGSQENLGMINRNLSSEYCVHGLDLRNHGRSPQNHEMNYSLMADDVLEYMDDQNLQSVILLGHSMGGKVAMALALKAPERVSALVVIDIAPVTYLHRKHDDVLDGLSSINLDGLQNRKEADRQLVEYVLQTPIRQFLLKNLYRKEDGKFGWRVNLKSIIEHYPEILTGQQADQPFPAKTLFIKGGASDYILPEHQDQVLKLFPQAQVRIITGAGHWVHAEKPELVARTIQRFLG